MCTYTRVCVCVFIYFNYILFLSFSSVRLFGMCFVFIFIISFICFPRAFVLSFSMGGDKIRWETVSPPKGTAHKRYEVGCHQPRAASDRISALWLDERFMRQYKTSLAAPNVVGKSLSWLLSPRFTVLCIKSRIPCAVYLAGCSTRANPSTVSICI